MGTFPSAAGGGSSEELGVAAVAEHLTNTFVECEAVTATGSAATTAFSLLNLIFRDVAQLVARLVWDQDVAGSNPVIPTKIADLTAFSGQIGANLIRHRRLCTVVP